MIKYIEIIAMFIAGAIFGSSLTLRLTDYEYYKDRDIFFAYRGSGKQGEIVEGRVICYSVKKPINNDFLNHVEKKIPLRDSHIDPNRIVVITNWKELER